MLPTRGLADGVPRPSHRHHPSCPTLILGVLILFLGAASQHCCIVGSTRPIEDHAAHRTLRRGASSEFDAGDLPLAHRHHGSKKVDTTATIAVGDTRRVPTTAECAPYVKRVTEYFPRRLGYKTSCPREIRWFDWFRRMDPSPEKTFVNIGCNKGMDVASFLHLWDPTFQTSDWVRKVRKFMRRGVGGACSQTSKARSTSPASPQAASTPCPRGSPKWGCSCQDISDVFGVGESGDMHLTPQGYKVKHPADVESFWVAHNCSTSPSDMTAYDVKPVVPPAADGARPVAFCVEIMPQTAEALKKVRGALPAEDQQLVVVDNVAVGSGYPKTVSVSNVGAGKETGGIGIKIKNTVSIPVKHVTLDSYTATKDTGPIDFLLIDTEGNDANVLFGGALTLKRTRFVAFENTEVGAWSQVSLRAVIDYLDALDFECYWAGNMGTLWQITGCYPYIDSKSWGNVACAKRGDLLLDTMRKLADANGGIPDLVS